MSHFNSHVAMAPPVHGRGRAGGAMVATVCMSDVPHSDPNYSQGVCVFGFASKKFFGIKREH